MCVMVDQDEENSDWAMALQKAMCWGVAGLLNDCAPLDWHSGYAGDARRGVSEAFRRDTKRGASQRNKDCHRTSTNG